MSLAVGSGLGPVAGSLGDTFSASSLQNIAVADAGIGSVVVDIAVEVVAASGHVAAVVGHGGGSVVVAVVGLGGGSAGVDVDVAAPVDVGVGAPAAAAVPAASAVAVLAAAAASAAAAAAVPAAAGAAAAAAAAAAAPAVGTAAAAHCWPAAAAAASACPMAAYMLSAARIAGSGCLYQLPKSSGNHSMVRILACVGWCGPIGKIGQIGQIGLIGHPLPPAVSYLHPMCMGYRPSSFKPCARKGYGCAVCVQPSNLPFPTDWDVLAYMCP